MRGHLDRLELHNFKSYGGDVVVGPFRPGFNCIVGTNGSGKSNAMDAISFVLGVRTSQLRGNQLRDLVYRNAADPDDDPSRRKAHVRIVYVTEKGRQLVFHRGVTIAGASEYKVDGRVVSMEKYNERLAGIGVLVKARNFLVFQNEVQGIASKSPKDLTSMFEEISGSAELKEAYDAARLEKDTAEEEVMHFWRKRKGMAAERKQYKEQKEEADKFKALQAQLASTRSERALFELFHIDTELESLEAGAVQEKAVLKELQGKIDEREATLEDKKSALSQLEKRRGQQTKKCKRLQVELERLEPTRIKYETEVSGLTRRIKGDCVSLTKAHEEADRRAVKLASLEAELAETAMVVAQLEKDIVTAEETSVSAAAMAEYRSLKEASSVRTAALQQDSASALRVRAVAEKQKEAVTAQMNDAAPRKAELMSDLAAYDDKVKSLEAMRAAAAGELAELEEEHARSAEVVGERQQIRARLEQRVSDVTQELRQLSVQANENSRRKKFDEAVDNMSRLFPGVKGRLSDLCKPTHDRYREAVAVVFGKLMDAIVVDNNSTGSECIAYLKEQRVGMATFIPLQNVRPRPVDESLRRLGGTSALVVDIVEHDASFAPAVQYAAGNALVCGTLDEARAMCYDSGRRLKVCALDGTLINKAGFMTGGTSGGDRAGKWDRKEIETLKRRRASAHKELAAMGPASDDRRITAERAEKIDALKRKIQILAQDRADAEVSQKRLGEELKKLNKEISGLQPEVDAAVAAWEKAEEDVLEIRNKMNGLENDLFGDFSIRNGVQTVAEFEEQFIRKSEGLRQQKLEAETKHSRLLSQVKYEQAKGKNLAVRRLESKIVDQRKRLEEAESNLENLLGNQSEMESRAEKLKDEVKTIVAEIEQLKGALKEARQEFTKDNEAVTAKTKSISQMKIQVKTLRSKRVRLLTDCKVEQVLVPLVGAENIGEDEDADEDEMQDVGDTATKDDGDDDDNEDEMSDIDDGNRKSRNSADDSVTVDASVTVDYSSLSRRARGQSSLEAQRAAISKYEDDIKSCEDQIENLAPNMRAGEHMADVSARLEQLDKEAEAAKNRAKDAVEAFETTKEERQELFNACFSHVAEKISDVYKQLTKSANYPMGGTAYLSLEQQDEPYLAGVKFNAMPPTKRFRDMEQLSGGEQTVAALSLLFAIHDFKPSPFFILDEVDAALDTGNVSKVSSYVLSRASELQTIVITLKDAFFEKADALVGIYRDTDVNASRILTLDLSPFDSSVTGVGDAIPPIPASGVEQTAN
jgi:structural maintenance of chromosome 1